MEFNGSEGNLVRNSISSDGTFEKSPFVDSERKKDFDFITDVDLLLGIFGL